MKLVSYNINMDYQQTMDYVDSVDSTLVDIWQCLSNTVNSTHSRVPSDACFDADITAHFASDGDSSEYDILKSPPYTLSVIICYAVVISLGALGNAMVVLTVIKAKKMWTATNIFIANLAVADIFVCLFDLPLSVYYQITGQWIFGATLCRIIPMVFAMVVYSSTLTLTMIAVDRFILVVHPLKSRLTPSAAFAFIAVIACISSGVAFPIALYGRYEIYEDEMLNLYRRLCYEHWPSRMRRQVYTISTLVMQFFIPLGLIGALYARIFVRIRKRLSRRRCSMRTKTTKMLAAVVGVFVCTWTPYHIHSLLSEYGVNPFGVHYKFADAMFRVLAMSSSCLNPFLYGWLNDNYKNAFLSIIRKPTQPPRGIRREESDRSRSNVCQQSPVAEGGEDIKEEVDDLSSTNCNNAQTNCNALLAPPERLQLNRLKSKSDKKEVKYQSLAHFENDPFCPVMIVVINDDSQPTDHNLNNNVTSRS